MALIKCPECGKEISDQANTCPHCGYEIIVKDNPVERESKKDVPIYKNRKYIGIAMCVVGCILLIIAITRVTNDEYKFYKQHYRECMDGYNDTKATANSSSGYFKGSYNYIASTYKDMADDDNKKLWTFRIQAIVLLCGGTVLILYGYKNYKKEKKDYGVNQMS